ncbi:hypothetical protein FXO38_17459 [Capsicum annuum]|nr:hypothetical protein FXO38_17459 [Capsicum annuum]
MRKVLIIDIVDKESLTALIEDRLGVDTLEIVTMNFKGDDINEYDEMVTAFLVMCDSSGLVLRAVLGQMREKILHLIYLALENLCDNFDQAVTISGDDLMKASSSIPNGKQGASCNDVNGTSVDSFTGFEASNALQYMSMNNILISGVQHELLKNQYDEECELLKKKYLEEWEIADRSTSMVEFDPSYENELLISCVGSSKKQFKFDYLFKLEDIQDIVFAQTMPIVTFVLDGYNVYIFTYGQTGTCVQNGEGDEERSDEEIDLT